MDGAEVADHLAVREPTSNPNKASVSDYVWDPDAGIMNLSELALDECPGTGAGSAAWPATSTG
ncbi:hypothetical protein [Streptomyces sp. ICC4]|uniref:hypothetical protein n=1 Tax=Streptomyces sp. ICC4 TaxID=2099584 RepID=UPI000DC76BB2|nr:hypothetical protein [Streptomyces sp. ICC4]AWZ09459.1 hypothetical protein DRB89_39020 [Streptomyces sp. ICC4]